MPSLEHETLTNTIQTLVQLLAGGMEIDFQGAGSTTFDREDLEKGFEPDACFYIQHALRVRGKKRIDLTEDPPPDLVIEVDIANDSLNEFPIYAAIGVPEVWRYFNETLSILRLERQAYVPQLESFVLPKITASALSDFIRSGQELTGNVWMHRVLEWAKILKGPA